jgi:hypothetical protein
MKKWTAPITIQELTDEEKLEVIDQLLKHSGFFLVSEEDRSLPRARKILLLPEPPFSGVPERG